jgi:hypothetical protein
MKRKNYLHTKFLKFLIESEKESQKENDDIDKVLPDDIENDDDTENDLDADDVIERLYERIKKTSKEYDDIIYGRK